MEASKKIRRFILSSVIPIACCIAVGLLFFRTRIFVRYVITFQFVVTGIAASVFYALMCYFESKWTYAGLLLLFGAQVLMDHTLSSVIILRDALYIGGIGLTVALYLSYFGKKSRGGFIFPIVTLAGLYPLIVIITTEIDAILLKTFWPDPRILMETKSPFFVAPSALLAVLIGFALGVGITIVERFVVPAEVPESDMVRKDVASA